MKLNGKFLAVKYERYFQAFSRRNAKAGEVTPTPAIFFHFPILLPTLAFMHLRVSLRVVHHILFINALYVKNYSKCIFANRFLNRSSFLTGSKTGSTFIQYNRMSLVL